MRLAAKALVLLLGLAAMPSGESRADDNWARDYVRKREAAVFERMTGIDPRTLPGAGPGMIIGGKTAPEGRWPFQVALLMASDSNNFNAQFCGGSIIGNEFIMTAAHCADFLKPSQIHVLTDTQSLRDGGVRRSVRAIRIHPSYNKHTFDYDVAVLQLDRRISNLRADEKVRLLRLDNEEHLAAPGTKSYVTGWGTTGSTFPAKLHEVAVPLVDSAICNAKGSYKGGVTDRMICAGLAEGGKDTCAGDSGGPLLVRSGDGRFIVQAGITSWGEGCALPDLYGVYSRVAALESWISDTMDRLRR